MKTARQIAFKDISKHVLELQGQNNMSYADQWYVTPTYMDNFHSKETTRLNRKLGVHKVNMSTNGDRFKEYRNEK